MNYYSIRGFILFAANTSNPETSVGLSSAVGQLDCGDVECRFASSLPERVLVTGWALAVQPPG